MMEVYHRCAENLIPVLENHFQTSQPLELQEIFKRFTLDTFGEIGFGYKVNSLKAPVLFSETFDWLQLETDYRLLYPWRRIFCNGIWKSNLNILESFVVKIIEERKKEGWEGKKDFLSKLLEMEANQEITGVTPKFLRDQVVNFLVAGRDTTAILLASTFYFLSLNPDVDAKVREEIARVVGNEKFDMKHSKHLRYLQNVINESLRLFPPAVPFNSRVATKDVVLPNKVRVTKGTLVMYTPYIVHRLKEYWGNDAEQFRPERWDDPNVLKHNYQYIPFQKGPRICLGMNMAQEEAKCCISILYQHGFRFELISPRPSDMTLVGAAILSSKEGINVRVLKQ
uniref:Cytochrome P450 n=1 Tax=Arcella intermedia TaxID=1963864 RepID=A0A6B2L774_9EUKA